MLPKPEELAAELVHQYFSDSSRGQEGAEEFLEELVAAMIRQRDEAVRGACLSVLYARIKIETNGKCCDNCNCLALKTGIEGIMALELEE